MMAKQLKGKRILICQPIIGDINGSTMVTLELCEFLRANGASVYLYSYYYMNPAKTLFDNLDISIHTFEDNPNYQIEEFDYIWIHSQVIPISIISQLWQDPDRWPIFIFLHMSVMDYIPDERPYLYLFEESVADKVLFISEETKEKNMPFFAGKIDWGYFRNPAPEDFINMKEYNHHKLRKILIVSNHPPQELIQAKNILKKKKIAVEMLGERQEKYCKITPKILSEYDVIVTIGKTVQYCLVSGTPVYIYDYFGGPGWLNESSYEKAKKYNFSGRGFERKTADMIALEITSGFLKCLEYQRKQRKDFIEEFSISNSVNKILSSCKKQNHKALTKQQILSLKEAQMFASIRFSLDKDNRILKAENKHLLDEIQEITSAKSYKMMVKALSVIKK